MSPTVVDQLEPIDVEEEDGDQTAVSFGTSQRLADAVAQQATVGQAGELVVEGLAFEALLCQLAFGDVASDALDGDDAAVLVAHEAEALLDPDRRTVPPLDQDLPRAGQVGTVDFAHHLDVLRLEHVEDQVRVRIQLGGRVAGDRLACWADVVEAGLRRQPVAEDEVVGVLGQQPEPVFTGPEPGLGIGHDGLVEHVVGDRS